MIKLSTFPFKAQISFLFIVITLGLTFFYYQYNLNIQSRFLENQFIEKNNLLFKTVQLGLEVGLQTERFDAIQTVFKWAKKQNNLSWIIITDEKKEVFATFPDKLNHEPLLKLPLQNIQNEQYIIQGPWNGSGVKGYVKIAFSTEELFLQGQKILEKSLMIATVVILISILLSMQLSRLIIAPLESLQKVIHTIAQGNFSKTLDKFGGSKETVSLGWSFNLMMNELNKERERSENLLLNILPKPVALRLKAGEQKIAMSTDFITIMFADLVGYTQYSSTVSAEELVDMLNIIFSKIDDLILEFGLEKIKTIGDCYMVSGGIFGDADHEIRMYQFTKRIISMLASHNNQHKTDFKIRIGIHRGKAVAGVLGKSKFVFDVWGDAVNIASRMESSGEPDRIQASSDFTQYLKEKIEISAIDRGKIKIKGKGEMNCFFLN